MEVIQVEGEKQLTEIGVYTKAWRSMEMVTTWVHKIAKLIEIFLKGD